MAKIMVETAVRPLTDTPLPPLPAARPRGFFEANGPAWLIVLAFPLLCLPLAAATAVADDGRFLLVYLWLFGMTHFVVTLSVYASAANLRHFAATPRNRLVFLGLPVLIFVGFDALHVTEFGPTFPAVVIWVWAAIRVLDFNHFTRQAFGVLQLFKARAKGRYPDGTKPLENAYFAALTAALWCTFLAGGASPVLPLPRLFDPLLPLPVLAVGQGVAGAVAVGLLAVVMSRYQRATGDPAARRLAGAYLLAQSAAGLLAVAWFPLYAAALAVHYVEYHVLMYPRIFHTPLDPTARIDRLFGRVRASRAVFYAGVLGVAAVISACGVVGMGALGGMAGPGGTPLRTDGPLGLVVLIAAFDGLFVFHYLVEMFLWKFSDPHFRKTLAPLYFVPKAG